MSIAQIREYAALAKQGNSTLARRREILAAHRTCVEAKIEEWAQALELIDHKIDFYGQWLATGRRPRLAAPMKPQKRQWNRRNA